MRLVKKYKNFAKNKLLIKGGPLKRLLMFKKAKWKPLQILSKRSFLFSTRPRLFNHLLLNLRFDRYKKLKLFYKEGLYLKRALTLFFDNNVSTYAFKRLAFFARNKLSFNEKQIQCLIQPFFYLEILLWKLGLFESSYHALQSMHNGFILVDNKQVFTSKVLTIGSVITFTKKIKLSSYYSKSFLCSLIEIDLYTQQIIMVKSLKNLTEYDVALLIPELVSLPAFFNYIDNK